MNFKLSLQNECSYVANIQWCDDRQQPVVILCTFHHRIEIHSIIPVDPCWRPWWWQLESLNLIQYSTQILLTLLLYLTSCGSYSSFLCQCCWPTYWYVVYLLYMCVCIYLSCLVYVYIYPWLAVGSFGGSYVLVFQYALYLSHTELYTNFLKYFYYHYCVVAVVARV